MRASIARGQTGRFAFVMPAEEELGLEKGPTSEWSFASPGPSPPSPGADLGSPPSPGPSPPSGGDGKKGEGGDSKVQSPAGGSLSNLSRFVSRRLHMSPAAVSASNQKGSGRVTFQPEVSGRLT